MGDVLFAWSADGKTLATTLPNDQVGLLDPHEGKELKRFDVFAGPVSARMRAILWQDGSHSLPALALSSNGKLLLASAINGTYVALWDARTGHQLAKLEPGFQVSNAAFSPDGKSCFTFGMSGLGYRWDVEKLIAMQNPKK